MASLIDAHCHLSELSSQELEETLFRAKVSGVDTLIAIGAGYGFDDNAKTLTIANAHENIYCALAMHPHDADKVTDDNFKLLTEMISSNPKVCAVGEIGLDYHYMNSPKEQQQKVFQNFIEFAKAVKKPVVIHDRDCGYECIDTLKRLDAGPNGGMVHCFSGSQDMAHKYLDLGFYVSFTGIITFKKADDLRAVVKSVPLDRMTIETDSPFLAPVPFRGKKNEPGYVKHVAECVAQIKGVTFEEVAENTTRNARKLFGINN